MKSTFLIAIIACAVQALAVDITPPRVLDTRLEVSLLASEPDIVTPVGLAADRRGRLFVVETHTHARNSRYQGPPGDRILVYEDTDGDGFLDHRRIHADGLRNALAIAFSGEGDLYVLQMKSVVGLRDADGDGVLEPSQPLLTIETDNNNHHGVFLALAFDDQDRLLVSLGNIGGHAYSIRGTDDSEVAGQGDTGLIVRCDANGSDVERFAHGFWNPCDLRFDTAGRLLATDNDPDARGPNRVLHVIRGGRYGYKARFGGSGRHPYCAWNGELPGTLPMVAGLGEAPVGVLDCGVTSLPQDYADSLLACIWGTNQVVRIRTRQRGVSIAGDTEPLIVGGKGFRPTGIAATSNGTVYIADWADRRYPVHGKGRIWRLAAKQPSGKCLEPQLPWTDVGSGQRRLAAYSRCKSFPTLVRAATDTDPFLASTALTSLAHGMFRESIEQLLDHPQASHRLAALLALRNATVELESSKLRKLLHDDDAEVRRMTMIWLGETMRMELASDLRQSMTLQTASAELFDTFLATSQLLTEAELKRVESRTPGNRIDRRVDQHLIRTVLADDRRSPVVRAMAAGYLNPVDDPSIVQLVLGLAESDNDTLASQAIRTLADSPSDLVSPRLSSIATGVTYGDERRCDAIMSLDASDAANIAMLMALLDDDAASVSLTAARVLSAHVTQPAVRRRFNALLESHQGRPEDLLRQVRFALNLAVAQRPQTDDQWEAATRGGDAEAGRRVFLDRSFACGKCHRYQGRGGQVGPDLTNIGDAKTRVQILASVLHPSQDRSPDYQGYLVVMQDGRMHQGTQFHFRGESADLLTIDGEWIRFRLDETEDYRPLETSLMPEDLASRMSVGQLRDLIAFLAQ